MEKCRDAKSGNPIGPTTFAIPKSDQNQCARGGHIVLHRDVDCRADALNSGYVPIDHWHPAFHPQNAGRHLLEMLRETCLGPLSRRFDLAVLRFSRIAQMFERDRLSPPHRHRRYPVEHGIQPFIAVHMNVDRKSCLPKAPELGGQQPGFGKQPAIKIDMARMVSCFTFSASAFLQSPDKRAEKCLQNLHSPLWGWMQSARGPFRPWGRYRWSAHARRER